MDGKKSLRRMMVMPALFLLASVFVEIGNCRSAQTAIQAELSDTIMALAKCEDNLIAKQDTIRRLERINYAMAQPLVMVADQKMPGALLALSVVSMMGAVYYRRRMAAAVPVPSALPGQLPSVLPNQSLPSISPALSAVEAIHLTPMQRQLVNLLQSAPDNCVPKSEICAALWGNKDNAEESLYTLIRRTKKVLTDSNMEIVCNRGESYQLLFS